MKINNIYLKARENMKGFCRVCPVCNGVACAGEVPGMGGAGTGKSFKENVADLEKVKINLRTIHDVKDANTEFNLFNKKLSMPIIIAPVAGSQFNMGEYMSEEDYIKSIVYGAVNSSTLAMLGDSAYPELYEMAASVAKNSGGKAISIIKPRTDLSYIKKCFNIASQTNQIAVGIDIDSAGHYTMGLKGAPVSPKTIDELKDLKKSTKLPFILKGIMTVDEAIIASQIGADAIVVSNHGGRISDSHPSTASVLYGISKAVKGSTKVLVDGGIRSGNDVFKMLALGADGVLIGRPLIIAAYGGGEKAVSTVLNRLQKELAQTMIISGASKLEDINESMIIKPEYFI